MDKRKTIFTAVVIGAGIMAVIDRIRLLNKVNDLEERTKCKCQPKNGPPL